MALKYLRKATVLPNPDGPLSDRMPSAAISSANNELKDLVNATPSDSRKRGPYHNYTDEDRALIGKRATEFGVTHCGIYRESFHVFLSHDFSGRVWRGAATQA